MTILFISDTHHLHRQLPLLLPADVIVHAGDVSSSGADHEVEDFIRWFGELKSYKYKIFIAGNHDFYFEHESLVLIQRQLSKNMFYLCDSGVEIDGVKFWGSPVSPRFFDLAFNRSRGTKIRKHWQLIPPDTDVLITHTPPFGILDQNERGSHTSCEDLLEAVLRIKPRYHLFGHIHEAYGTQATAHTTFINGSIVDATDKIANKPIIIEYEK